MKYHYGIKNLVFSGGGVLGISYIGALKYLYENNHLKDLKRVAGTSAGAITACILSFNLSFQELERIAESLEYKKVPGTETHSSLKIIPPIVKKEIEKVLGDVDGLYRLSKDYGWYSSQYFYEWLKIQIANQFKGTGINPPNNIYEFNYAKHAKPFLMLFTNITEISTTPLIVFVWYESIFKTY